MKMKMVGDPAPSGKGGVKTRGESAATKKALAHSSNAKFAQYGRKK